MWNTKSGGENVTNWLWCLKNIFIWKSFLFFVYFLISVLHISTDNLKSLNKVKINIWTKYRYGSKPILIVDIMIRHELLRPLIHIFSSVFCLSCNFFPVPVKIYTATILKVLFQFKIHCAYLCYRQWVDTSILSSIFQMIFIRCINFFSLFLRPRYLHLITDVILHHYFETWAFGDSFYFSWYFYMIIIHWFSTGLTNSIFFEVNKTPVSVQRW